MKGQTMVRKIVGSESKESPLILAIKEDEIRSDQERERRLREV